MADDREDDVEMESPVFHITEYLDADLATATWSCNRCGQSLGELRRSYKYSCRVRERDPREIHHPGFDAEFNFGPDPEWCRLIEFYCPGCFTLIEAEYLPPGYPPTMDIELDVDALIQKAAESAGDREEERVG